MIEKLEYYEPSEEKNGFEGAEIDFVNKRINYVHTATPEKITKKNLEIVNWVIEKNLTAMKKKRQKMTARINQKEDMVKVPIVDGMLYFEKLSPTKLASFKVKLKALEEQIKEIEKINVKKLV